MNYTDFSVEDFAMDAEFQLWVQHPDVINDAFWQKWLQEHPQKLETVQQARSLVLLLNLREDVPAAGEEEEVWAKVRERIQPRGTVRQLRAESPWQPLRKWAAAVALLLTLGVIFYLVNTNKGATYHTAFGETQDIVLTDGTSITLNANSTLEVQSNWWGRGDSREVKLEGEAFFKVVKKQGPGDKRFTVHTSALDVEVLGTQFNVFSRERGTQVVLNSGKVKLALLQEGEPRELLMKPGELVELEKGASQPVKRKVEPSLYNDWTRKEWVLENTSLSAVASRLKESFGLEVSYASPDIAQERMSGVFSTENVTELLDALSTINNLDIRQEGKQLYISRQQ